MYGDNEYGSVEYGGNKSLKEIVIHYVDIFIDVIARALGIKQTDKEIKGETKGIATIKTSRVIMQLIQVMARGVAEIGKLKLRTREIKAEIIATTKLLKDEISKGIKSVIDVNTSIVKQISKEIKTIGEIRGRLGVTFQKIISTLVSTITKIDKEISKILNVRIKNTTFVESVLAKEFKVLITATTQVIKQLTIETEIKINGSVKVTKEIVKEIKTNVIGFAQEIKRVAYGRIIEIGVVGRAMIEPVRVVIIKAIMTGTAQMTKLPNKMMRAIVWCRIKFKEIFWKTKYSKQEDSYESKYEEQSDNYHRKY